MRTDKGRSSFAQLWKRNAVVGAIALFVCVAVYLNWSYDQEAGKTLGEAALVGSESGDALLDGTQQGQAEVQGAEGDANAAADSEQSNGTTSSSNYFATARVNRQQARDSALTLLQEAAAGDGADQTLKNEANAAIQTMADYTVTEAQIENMVVAKGYIDCVAFIGEDSLSLVVAAPEGGITDADTARIVDVVNQATGFTASQIKIIEVE